MITGIFHHGFGGCMETLMIGNSGSTPVSLDIHILQRHVACFGASGSGKTVACKVMAEELVRAGVPLIVFDPQGDIASLALPETDDALLASKGIELPLRNGYASNAEVVIWTPGSSKGIPLSINPLQFDDLEGLDAEDRLRYLSATAKNVSELIGYDAGTDEGKSAESVLATVFEHCAQQNIRLQGFSALIEELGALPEPVQKTVNQVSSPKTQAELIKKLRFLTVGSRKLLFETGVPASIDMLLGKDQPANGKTRVSVIYLNTLSSQQEKEFFMANITQLLYNWMLKHPLKSGQDGLQAVLYIDEIAPFLPPVKMPSCKESLMLLFKQARKYGVGCLIATQNPGDVDYKSIAQISTYLIGSLKTKQDLGKIETRLESMLPEGKDRVMATIPALQKGTFLLLSPDQSKEVITVTVRWLLTRHMVISEEQIGALVPEEIRSRYGKMTAEAGPSKKAPEGKKKEPDTIPASVPRVETIENAADVEAATGEDALLWARHTVFEADLSKKVRRYLKGVFFGLFKTEKLSSAAFEYRPLLKADMVFHQKKGLFHKTVVDVPLTLYLDYKTLEILALTKREIHFAPLHAMDPHKIPDLDGVISWQTGTRSTMEWDFRKLGKKLQPKEIVAFLQKKYDVDVTAVTLVLLPVWQCTVLAKKGGASRVVLLDAVSARSISG
jgi:hypothetical protein